MCEHKRQKNICKECEGNAVCEHNNIKYTCKECNGASLCHHGRRRSTCILCGGGSVCECGERLKQKDGVCTRCHPNFIQSKSGSSKIACTFFDTLEKEIGVSIQHIHYDFGSGAIVGVEHKPTQWPKKGVDGFYHNSDGSQFAFEFLGDECHGHPRFWDKQGLNYYGKTFKNAFYDTETKLQKLSDFGYWVVYIWESEFKNKPALSSLHSICRTFNGKLEYNL